MVWLLLEDDMNRKLTTEISEGDSSLTLVQNLVQHGFICEVGFCFSGNGRLRQIVPREYL